MQILYGANTTWINVYGQCIHRLKRGDTIIIPSGDNNRAAIFSDPCIGVYKSIRVIPSGNDADPAHSPATAKQSAERMFDHRCTIHINVVNGSMFSVDEASIVASTELKISLLHSKLSLMHGSFMDELPEQKMVARYFTGSEKVLEIGGNIGRNSLIIASILKASNNSTGAHLNLVSLESDTTIADQLRHNASMNNLSFHVESSALSKRKLMQQGWNTTINDTDVLPHGYSWINTITYDELCAKYGISFDTLVLDCEGAFYYIVMDMPEILESIQLIVMENDYHVLAEKQYVNDALIRHGFYRVYVESGGWGPCQPVFFEVWRRSCK